MTAATHWWWVRHAPVKGAAGRIYGTMDVGCDTGDSRSFRALENTLPSDAVWVISPLRRTRETLEAISAANPSPDPVVEPDFAEQNFGDWQGLSWDEMQAADPHVYEDFWRDPTRTAPPQGESFETQMRRTRAAIERLTAVYEGRNIVSVSHGGTIRSAVALALDLTPENAMAVVIDNLSLTRLGHVKDGLLKSRGGVWLVEGVNVSCRWIP
jgi:alpha-ribazole phosphatase